MPGPQVILNMNKLLELEREAPGRADEAVGKVAKLCTDIIGLSWSDQQPSPPGGPPGVDTSALKNSVVYEPGNEPLTWIVHDGVEYGVHLEYGTEKMAARPWLLPAVEQTAAMIPPEWLQEVVK